MRSNYINACEICGKELPLSGRVKFAMLAEKGVGVFSTSGWAMYMCAKCAAETRRDLEAKSCR